jgi:thiamine pyrophosphate-dependent acetolactate synthase large subunit-like protein
LSNVYEENFGKRYSRSLKTLGETMVEVIRFFGGRRIYGIGGDFAANLINAFDGSLELCPSSNEMHAGFSACAQAEVSGVGFCLTTFTVGSLPCVSAAALAKAERLPVVFISGAPAEDEATRGVVHHAVHPSSSWLVDYDAARRAFAGLSVKAERLQGDRHVGQPNLSGYRFYELVLHAYQNKEPVFIEVPRDLITGKTQSFALPETISDTTHQPMRMFGADAIAEFICRKISDASCPLLYIGDQIKLNRDVLGKIELFCARHQIPFATSWLSKGVFDEEDPLCLGAYNGVFSSEAVRHFIESQVDYVIDIGSSIIDMDIANALYTETHAIRRFSNRTVIKTTVPWECDIETVFDLLLSDTTIKTFPGSPVRVPGRVIANDERVDFHNVIELMNEVQRGSKHPFVYLPEVGNSFFASYGLQTRKSGLGRSWLCNPWYGAMGTSLPYARAVAEEVKSIGTDDRVVVMTGDGGFHFQLNELIHFQKAKLPLVIVYMRNNIFALGKCGDAEMYRCSSAEFDVLKLVAAYGGVGVRCETALEFKTAFAKATEVAAGITLIEVSCIPTPDYECREMSLLNLYTRARNGEPVAIQEWQRICALTV